jgi:hypothetical protein
MAVIYEVCPGKAVRRPSPKRWHPDFLKTLVPEYDAEPADHTQLDLFKRQRASIRDAFNNR